jgi:hypothetical protein
MKALLPLVVFLAFGCSSATPSALKEDLRLVFDGSYLASQDAWSRVERKASFEGKSRATIAALIGAPDIETADGICYKTAAGPLWFDLVEDRAIGVHLISTPPRWRGTQEEAAEWWKKTRETKDWYAF